MKTGVESNTFALKFLAPSRWNFKILLVIVVGWVGWIRFETNAPWTPRLSFPGHPQNALEALGTTMSTNLVNTFSARSSVIAGSWRGNSERGRPQQHHQSPFGRITEHPLDHRCKLDDDDLQHRASVTTIQSRIGCCSGRWTLRRDLRVSGLNTHQHAVARGGKPRSTRW